MGVTVGTPFTTALICNKPLAKYGCVTRKKKSNGEEEERVQSVDIAKGERIGGKSFGRGS